MLKTEFFENEDGKFIIFSNDAIANHLKSGRPWEPHFREIIKLINTGDYVVDAGANFGYNAVMMGKKLGPDGVLIAFEPQKIIYQQLNGNIILNNIFNSYTFNTALSNKSGEEIHMNVVNYNSEWVNIGDTSVGHGGEKVSTLALDDLELLSNFNFLKLDVQGYELFVLEGGINVIRKFMPYIFIEVEPHQLDKFHKQEIDIFNFLKNIGYEVYNINNEYPCDHICCPPDKSNAVLQLNLSLVKI
jgi:FkbM family methyltransferase